MSIVNKTNCKCPNFILLLFNICCEIILFFVTNKLKTFVCNDFFVHLLLSSFSSREIYFFN